MLVLARKPGEAIQIGDGITVHVVEIRGKQVRLGIEAPAKMPIHRSEIHERISARDVQTVDLAHHQSKAMTAEESSQIRWKKRTMMKGRAEAATMDAGRSAQRERVGNELPHGTVYW